MPEKRVPLASFHGPKNEEHRIIALDTYQASRLAHHVGQVGLVQGEGVATPALCQRRCLESRADGTVGVDARCARELLGLLDASGVVGGVLGWCRSAASQRSHAAASGARQCMQQRG